ncbi:MAG: response regulator [Desulfobacterales bacterium]|uniref:Response regulator n=1 Tax=Candidatus Desulfatibia vada TaxID=2841696 RepID=A0A8J6P1G9_9BACT|nr:response regulator [Candidatus Desulfatibia vada]MBL6971908.1 response regulator [Desulfobacterales bacterium]
MPASPPNVLVIDDNEVILEMLAAALTRFGFNIVTAADGLEGIKKFDQGSFNLVITDISMPKLDGIGVARHIRSSEKRSTPVIAISGTPWIFKDGVFDAGFSKPFSITDIVDTVNNLTTHPHIQKKPEK